MQYRKYGGLGYQVSALGFGCMRLPRIIEEGWDKAQVDKEKAYEMIRYAAEHGINYFDTALTYHNMEAEQVLGEALHGIRDQVRIVTKQLPGSSKTIAEFHKNFEGTLKSLRTDYLDVYLMHNMSRESFDQAKRRGLYHEYEKLRDQGLIRAIGFSIHGDYRLFQEIVETYSFDMCQVQQNILDVDREATEQAIRLAGEKGLALAIMEPLRGGGLVTPPEQVRRVYDAHPVKRKAIDWAFRHLVDYPEVSVVLSGMTTLDQLKENIAIFSQEDFLPGCLTDTDKTMLRKVRDTYESLNSIPCTGCEYCMPCPNGVQISESFFRYNEGVMCGCFDQPRRAYTLVRRRGKDAGGCVACGVCETKCPQRIPIARELKKAHEALKGWIE